MGQLRVVVLLAMFVAGCDEVFGLSRVDAASVEMPPQADEDDDGVPDVLDGCPGTYDRDQLDRDHDQVGDACDPHPDVPGDEILAFAAFSGGFDGGWLAADPSAWMLAPQHVQNLANTTIGHGAIGTAGRFAIVELGYTAKTFPAMSSLRLTMQGASGMQTCFINYDPPDFGLFLPNSGSASVSTQDPHLRMVFHSDPTMLACSDVAGVRSSPDVVGGGPTTLSLSIENDLVIDLRYIVIYDAP